jgi:hypothetical protein
MRYEIVNISEETGPAGTKPLTTLSFGPFLEYVRMRLQDTETIKKEIYHLILQKFSKYPELQGIVNINDTGRYKEVLNLLYIALSTIVEDERKVLWGLSVPVSPAIFYGSDALYEFLLEAGTQKINSDILAGHATLKSQQTEMLYSFLLDRFYNFSFNKKSEIIRSFVDRQTGLINYFRVNIDTRFVKVTAERPLPEINLETLQVTENKDAGFAMLKNMLPLDLFHFSGFSIITITDVTVQYALERIKDILVNVHGKADEASYEPVVQSLKAMAGSNELEFNLLPLFHVNHRIVQDIDANNQSIIFSVGKQHGMKNFFLPLVEKFIANPHPIYYRDLDVVTPSQRQVGEILKLAAIKSFALLPVYYNKKLVGSFEIYTKQKGLLDENIFTKIEPAMALIAQLMQNSVDEFNAKINDAIRDKFTSLQASVQWRFNEAAWDYLYHSKSEGKPAEVEKIEFKQVHPLYGAIDMRNSTVERNKAVLNDLQYQFSLLQDVFNTIKEKSTFGLTEEFIFKCNKWQTIFQGIFTTNDEIKLNQFLNEEAHPFLRHFRDSNSAISPAINSYFEAIEQGRGKAWQHRQELEDSMQTINNAVNNYLDLMNAELQRAYPCYFEKFRTDGVEYDIYIGQSISPEKPFDLVYLKNLRLWQLTSMAAIAKLSHSLLPKMKVKLETTQLIFIYSNTIDISFRNDERKFDVEGGYNIRYHIIKKRIDKVSLKNSRERLTQPGKIALIYFNQKDADEYISYIHHLQEKKILKDDLEFLDLEELQGVSGLKALRVGVDPEYGTFTHTVASAQQSTVRQ